MYHVTSICKMLISLANWKLFFPVTMEKYSSSSCLRDGHMLSLHIRAIVIQIQLWQHSVNRLISSSNASRILDSIFPAYFQCYDVFGSRGANFSPNLTPFLVKVKRFLFPPLDLRDQRILFFWQLNWFNQTFFSSFTLLSLDANSQSAKKKLAAHDKIV